ncbi:MAG: tRNA lysidine(34) synthetase TilS [Nitrospirae bacterium]|nr:tRNA lysidine(34) synthetase TilS [Nitrospirota bacterium]
MSRSLQRRAHFSEVASRVAATARTKRLFAPGERLLVAVSGGPDSVALLSILAELAISWDLALQAVHINHGLRGTESETDARFVANLCGRMGIPLTCERVSLAVSSGRLKGRSLQEVAREARYTAMHRVGEALGVDKIAVGHTADDQAETLVMWMLRGAGTAGLAGIPPSREPLFIRPLLEISRADILSYLRSRELEFREDSSNTKPLYLRNRIRQELLPVLKRFNPAILDVLKRQAEILREEDLCLEQLVSMHLARMTHEGADGEMVLDRKAMLTLPVALQRRMIRSLLRRTSGVMKGPTFGAVRTVLERIVHGRSGSALTVHGAFVAREYEKVRFRSSQLVPHATQSLGAAGEDVEKGLVLPVPSTIRWPLTGQTIRVCLGSAHPTDTPPRMGRNVAIFDADRLTMKLVVRPWLPGDAFYPFGMHGQRKKLQDYFADIKLPREERRRIPLLVAPEGILWIGGLRSDERFRPSSSTTRTLIAELLDGTSHRGE